MVGRSTKELDGMRVGVVASLLGQGAAVILTVLYAYGLLLAAIWILPRYVVSGEWPQWPWWGYAMAPLLVGAAAALIEALGMGLIKMFGARWGIIAILVLAVGALFVSVVVQSR